MAGAKHSMADSHDHISSSSSGLLHGPQKDMRSGSIPHPLLRSPHPLHASAQKVENEQGKARDCPLARAGRIWGLNMTAGVQGEAWDLKPDVGNFRGSRFGLRLALQSQACNPTCTESRGRRIESSRPAWATD